MRLLIIFGYLFFFHLAVFAQQTIFNVPSADVTEKGRIYFEHESQTNPFTSDGYWTGTHYLAYGLGHNTEIDLTLYNVSAPSSTNISLGLGFKSIKDLLAQEKLRLTAGSEFLIPLQGQNPGYWAYSHLSTRLPKANTRLTAGLSSGTSALFGRSTVHFIAGIEQPITSKFALIADWFSGTHGLGLFTPGFSYAIPSQDLTFFVGYHIPNNSLVLPNPGLTVEIAKFF